jgi:hypothetical protein
VNDQKEGKAAGKVGAVSIGPGLGAAILAKASCPLCYPAIGGFLTSIGLGFLFEGVNFYILAGLFIFLALFGLAFKAKSRRGYNPFWLGIVGIVIGVLGRYFAIEILFYIGVIVLAGASVWNLTPKKKVCSAC